MVLAATVLALLFISFISVIILLLEVNINFPEYTCFFFNFRISLIICFYFVVVVCLLSTLLMFEIRFGLVSFGPFQLFEILKKKKRTRERPKILIN